MNLLLDTHALLWSADAPEKLSLQARTQVEDASNRLFFSAASVWEIAIKVSIEKLRLSISPEQMVQLLGRAGFLEVPIESQHAARVATMPLHHRDPFDRLLVAQAELERMTLVSRDGGFDAYGIRRLW